MRRSGCLVLAGALLAPVVGCEAGGEPGAEVGGIFLTRQAPVPLESPEEMARRFQGRLEAARAIHNPFERDEALEKLAVDAARVGQAEVVQEAVQGVNNPFDRDAAAGRCASILARSGQGHAALEVAQLIHNPFDRDAALKKLAAGG